MVTPAPFRDEMGLGPQDDDESDLWAFITISLLGTAALFATVWFFSI